MRNGAKRSRRFAVANQDRAATAQEIIDFVGGRIARYKRPKYVAFVDAMPKTAAGAIDRAKVKETHGRRVDLIEAGCHASQRRRRR